MAIPTQFSGFSLLKHQIWEDGASMVLGFLVVLSPWLSNAATGTAMMITTGFVGVLIVAMAGLEMVSLRRWEETIETLCGAWLIASPFVFGYGGALKSWHIALGALVVLLAVYELWQDWDRKLEG
ncbi:MAG: SPW repeat protein [Hyphomicrobiales bacterium]|nr:SPW repeat protein [Hyphomicrobiales bacterium]